MARWAFVAVTVLMLAACGGGPAADVRSGSAHLVIDGPRSGQVLSVRSVGVAVRVEGVDHYRLRYYLDGGDRGEGDTTFTLTNLSPGNHRVEVEGLHGDSSAYSPPLRAGVDFVIQ